LLPAGAALPAPDPAIPAIVQRCVMGAEYSSCSIAHDGRVASTVIYRAAQKSGSVAVAFERVEHPAIADWITRFIAAARQLVPEMADRIKALEKALDMALADAERWQMRAAALGNDHA
jgi:predicted oxidoreductase